MATDETGGRPWADLPVNVLENIKSKLYSSTLVRFMVVCKRWREFGNRIRPITDIPLSTVHSYETRLTPGGLKKFVIEFEIYDPRESKTHKSGFDVLESDSYVAYGHDLQHRLKVYGSKRGWVLVEEKSPIESRTLNLYNPFARHAIPLPTNFDNSRVSAATLSAAPVSPDCVLFVALRCNLGRSYMGTYRYGDENWDWTVYVICEDPGKTVKSLAYCEGEAMVYFAFQDGTLGNFNFLEKNSRIYDDTGFCYSIDSIHLVEYEGDILLASGIVNDGRYGYEWRVSKFNRPAMSWVSDGLQGRTLFVSDASFCVPAVETETGNLDGCVCNFFGGKVWMIYSLKAHWYARAENFGFRPPDGEQKKFWIEPPHLESWGADRVVNMDQACEVSPAQFIFKKGLYYENGGSYKKGLTWAGPFGPRAK